MNEWIDVPYLPEEWKRVLVVSVSGRIEIARWFYKRWHLDIDQNGWPEDPKKEYQMSEYPHWMPLPATPK